MTNKAESARAKNYLLLVLLLIYAFNFVDRFALGLVVDPIKAELHLTDSQIGLLSGIAFALFYSVMGIPIARWADRGNRVLIIALTAVLWSVMVALSGLAVSFVQLLLVRVLVGVGEAGCVPPAHSLMADYFDRAERPRASALYQQGVSVGLIVAYLLAGWLNEFFGWRVMFLALSIPGFILAPLAWLTIREPRLTKPITVSESEMAPSLKMSAAFATLWGSKGFRHVLFGFSLWYFFGFAISQWQPAFFSRSFALSTGEIGTWFSIVFGVCGLFGTYWGGKWASRYAASNERLQLRAMAVINIAFNGVVWSLIYLSHDYRMALVWTGLGTVGGTLIYGPLFSTIQTLVPGHMRAMSIAIVLLCANLVGMGLGPVAVGVLSDVLQPFFGQESLRYALLAMCPGYAWISWHFWMASNTVTQDVEAAQRMTDSIADDVQGVAPVAVTHG